MMLSDDFNTKVLLLENRLHTCDLIKECIFFLFKFNTNPCERKHDALAKGFPREFEEISYSRLAEV